MIRHTDHDGPFTIHEPEVLALLLELEADTLYDPELQLLPKDDKIKDDATVVAIRKALLARHAPNLTHKQRELLARAGEVELEHAGWILQASTFGFHLSVWPDGLPIEEFKVTYRRSNWSPNTGNKSRLFTDHQECVAWVDQQRRTGEYDYLHVQVRPVGQWQGYTSHIDYAANPD